MIIDNIAGLQYLMDGDIYLLQSDTDKLERAHQAVQASNEQPVAGMVESLTDASPAQTEVLIDFKYVGKNERYFLIICCYPDVVFMDDKHHAALISTLQRKELRADDVAILNIAKHEGITAVQLLQRFTPKRLLILGAQGLLSGWDKFTLNKIEHHEGIRLLYTYSFAEMMGDRDKTKAFWEQMKVL